MGEEVNFSEYNENFDHEVHCSTDWLNIHINMIYNELKEVRSAVYIFKIVNDEWSRRVEDRSAPSYSEIRTTLYESLVYRTILGLSKIFSKHREQSLLKATNQIEQLQLGNKEVRKTIDDIREKLLTSQMIKIVRAYRDKFFAHLDKESVLSYCRIDPTAVMTYIDIDEIDEWIHLIGDFYEVCFGKKLPCERPALSNEDIIHTFFWR